jgi:cysteinyl-tRNA synthetase
LAKEKSSKLKTSANVLGLLTQDVSQWNQGNKATKVDADKVEALIQERKDARANKDFARSDEIRDELLSMGVEIKDGRDGTTWSLV